MPIDPNIILNGFNPNLPDPNQLRQQNLQLQGMNIANQRNQVQLENEQEAQAFMRAMNESLKKYSSLSSQQPDQTGTPQTSGASLTSGTQPQDGSTGSASLGKDAYGNIIPKIGTESQPFNQTEGNGVPDNMTGPPQALSQGINPDLAAGGYQAPGSVPQAATTSTSASETGQPQAASNSLQSGLNTPAPGTTGMAGSLGPSAQQAPVGGNSPSATAASGYATITGPNGRTMTIPNTYAGLTTDWNKVMEDLTQRGYGMQAIQQNAARAAAISKGLEMQEKQFQMMAEQRKSLGSIAGSVSPVNDWTDQNQIAMAKASAVRGISLAMSQGLMEPHHAQALLQAIAQKGYTPDIQAEIQQAAQQGMDASQQFNYLAQQMRDMNSLMTGKLTRQNLSIGINDKLAGQAGTMLAAAHRNGQYSQALAELQKENPAIAARFPLKPQSEDEILEAAAGPKEALANHFKNKNMAREERHQETQEELGRQRNSIASENAQTSKERANIDARRLNSEYGVTQTGEKLKYDSRTGKTFKVLPDGSGVEVHQQSDGTWK